MEICTSRASESDARKKDRQSEENNRMAPLKLLFRGSSSSIYRRGRLQKDLIIVGHEIKSRGIVCTGKILKKLVNRDVQESDN